MSHGTHTHTQINSAVYTLKEIQPDVVAHPVISCSLNSRTQDLFTQKLNLMKKKRLRRNSVCRGRHQNNNPAVVAVDTTLAGRSTDMRDCVIVAPFGAS